MLLQLRLLGFLQNSHLIKCLLQPNLERLLVFLGLLVVVDVQVAVVGVLGQQRARVVDLVRCVFALLGMRLLINLVNAIGHVLVEERLLRVVAEDLLELRQARLLLVDARMLALVVRIHRALHALIVAWAIVEHLFQLFLQLKVFLAERLSRMR